MAGQGLEVTLSGPKVTACAAHVGARGHMGLGWVGGVTAGSARVPVGMCLCTARGCQPARASGPSRPPARGPQTVTRAWAGAPRTAARQVLTLGLARGGGLLRTGVLDEHVVLVVGAALLARLHHLHLRQRRVPLHHVLGAQGHQAADLQLAPAGTHRARPVSRHHPAPGPAHSALPSTPARPGTSQPKHGSSGQSQARRGGQLSVRQKHQAPRAQPQPQHHMPPKPLPVAGRPEEKDKKEGKAVTVTESFLRGMGLLGAGLWEGSGLGTGGGDHTERPLPGLGTAFCHLSPQRLCWEACVLCYSGRGHCCSDRSQDSPPTTRTDPKVGQQHPHLASTSCRADREGVGPCGAWDANGTSRSQCGRAGGREGSGTEASLLEPPAGLGLVQTRERAQRKGPINT